MNVSGKPGSLARQNKKTGWATDGLLLGLCLVSFAMTCAMLAGVPATWANVAVVVGLSLAAGHAVAVAVGLLAGRRDDSA